MHGCRCELSEMQDILYNYQFDTMLHHLQQNLGSEAHKMPV